FVALPQERAERRLRRGMLLLGGGGEPIDGKARILLHPLARQIKAAELILRLGVAEITCRVAVDVCGVTRIGRKRYGRDAGRIVSAERAQGLGKIFCDPARWGGIGQFVWNVLGKG